MRKYLRTLLVILSCLVISSIIYMMTIDAPRHCAAATDYLDLVQSESQQIVTDVVSCVEFEDKRAFPSCQILLDSEVRLMAVKTKVDDLIYSDQGNRVPYEKGGFLNITPPHSSYLFGSGEIRIFQHLPKKLTSLILNDYGKNCEVIKSGLTYKLYSVKGDFQICLNTMKTLGTDVTFEPQDDERGYLLFLNKDNYTYVAYISQSPGSSDLSPESVVDIFGV